MNYIVKRNIIDCLLVLMWSFIFVGMIIMSTPGLMLVSHWLLPEYDYIWYQLIEFIW